MKYSRFEQLVLAVGGAAILATVAFSFKSTSTLAEILGQVLLIVVLVGAVHWGRNGGFIAAVAASIIYIVMRIPLVANDVGLTTDIVLLIATRVIAYGLIGIVGGELCGRIMYVFANLEDANSTDEWSRVYNQKFISKSLDSLMGQHKRYQTPFSIVVVSMAPQIFAELRVSRQKYLVRKVADHIRNDIRMVDEVGRLDDGRFLVMLPQTPRDGGAVVADRLGQGVRDTLAAKCESITVVALSAPENVDEIDAILNELRPEETPEADIQLDRRSSDSQSLA